MRSALHLAKSAIETKVGSGAYDPGVKRMILAKGPFRKVEYYSDTMGQSPETAAVLSRTVVMRKPMAFVRRFRKKDPTSEVAVHHQLGMDRNRQKLLGVSRAGATARPGS